MKFAWHLHFIPSPSRRFTASHHHKKPFFRYFRLFATNSRSINRTSNNLIFFGFPMNVRVKPGSHMPPMYLRSSRRYHLDYFSDECEHMPPATRAIAELYRRHACEVELESTSQAWVNFAGMPAVKTGMSNVAGCFCSHIGTVSQAVPAAMSQVHRRHMRTRLYRESTVVVFHSLRSWNGIHKPPTC